jgi:hypothetical protein
MGAVVPAPGVHTREEDDVFFVIEGTMSFFVGGAWSDRRRGSLVIAPGGTAHDFENRTAERAGALNLSVPGDFEPHMEGIAECGSARAPPSRSARRTRHAANRSVQAADPLEGEGAVERWKVTSRTHQWGALRFQLLRPHPVELFGWMRPCMRLAFAACKGLSFRHVREPY